MGRDELSSGVGGHAWLTERVDFDHRCRAAQNNGHAAKEFALLRSIVAACAVQVFGLWPKLLELAATASITHSAEDGDAAPRLPPGEVPDAATRTMHKSRCESGSRPGTRAVVAVDTTAPQCDQQNSPSIVRTCCTSCATHAASAYSPRPPLAPTHPYPWPPPRSSSRTRTVEVSTGVHLHVAEAGPASGAPTVLLLHGFLELRYTWRGGTRWLPSPPPGTATWPVAPDMPGYGGSDAPPDADQYTALHVVGDLD